MTHIYTVRPDIVRYGGGRLPGKHVLFEAKVASPISTGSAAPSPRGAQVAFANTADGLRASLVTTRSLNVTIMMCATLSTRRSVDLRPALSHSFINWLAAAIIA